MKFQSLDEFVEDATERMIRRDETFTTLDITNPLAEIHLEGEDSRFAHHIHDAFDIETIVDLLTVATRKDSLVDDLFLGFFQIDHEVSLALVRLFHNESRIWKRLAIQRCPGRVYQACLSLIASKGNIESLCLYHNELGYPGFASLAMILAANPERLVTLDIEEFISPTAAEAFSAGLQMNTRLLTLDMHDCRLDIDSMEWLAEGIKGNSSLQTLRLDRCQLADEQCALVLKEIADHPTIRCVMMDDNFCSTETLAACANILRDSRLRNLHTLTLSHQMSLVDSRFSTPFPVAVLGAACASNSFLRKLSLANNLLNPAELGVLMKGVKRSMLEELYLEGCSIEDDTLELVLMNTPTTLKRLNLTQNLIANEKSMDLLLRVAKENLTLEILDIDNDLECWEQVCYFNRLNKAGRRLLSSTSKVPSGLWPFLLGHVSRGIQWESYHEDSDRLGFREDAIYMILKGPAFCGR